MLQVENCGGKKKGNFAGQSLNNIESIKHIDTLNQTK